MCFYLKYSPIQVVFLVQLVKMGSMTSIETVEDAVRAVEGGVMKEMENDAELQKRVMRVRAHSAGQALDHEKMELRISALGSRIQAARKTATSADVQKAIAKAEILYSGLSARAGNILTDSDKETLVTNLEEVKTIVLSLDGVASKRSALVMHCLNGLANAKVARAEGQQKRDEVMSQLYNLLQENESLEIPHSNAQVRLNHCLRICERILARHISENEVRDLEVVVNGVEDQTLPSASPCDGPGDDPPPQVCD